MTKKIEDLIKIREQKHMKWDKIHKQYIDMRHKYFNPILRKLRQAEGECDMAFQNIWYIFGLINNDGSRGRKNYTEQEKMEAKKYYYGGSK